VSPLAGAIATVLATSDEKMLSAIQSAGADDLLEMHVWLGGDIRNLLGLWDDGLPLPHYFREKGIDHPDDMSLEVLHAVRAELRGEEVIQ